MRRRAPQNVGIDFSGVRLTHFGGLYLLQRFLQRIRVRSLLTQYVRFAQRNSQYTIAEELLALIYPIALGISRIETTHLLKRNGVFQYLTGLVAARRQRFSPTDERQGHDCLELSARRQVVSKTGRVC